MASLICFLGSTSHPAQFWVYFEQGVFLPYYRNLQHYNLFDCSLASMDSAPLDYVPLARPTTHQEVIYRIKRDLNLPHL